MNEKQILKEIAYYSKLIHSHKKSMDKSKHEYVKPIKNYDKYKYIKKNEQSVITNVQVNESKKVLINPNFKTNIYINPNFNKNSNNIHINPKILNIDLKPTNIPKQIKSVHTKHKIINKNVPEKKTPVRKRRTSIRTKYKIIKNNLKTNHQNIKSNQVKMHSLQNSKLSTPRIINKYKIDRRSKSKSLQRKKVLRQSLSDTLRTTLFRNRTWKKPELKKYINKTSRLENKSKKLIVSTTGQKYIVDRTRKILKLVSGVNKTFNKPVKRITYGGVTYVHKSRFTYVKSNTKSVKNKKTNVQKSENKNYKTNNIPCPVYHRFGKCRRKDLGRCIFKHNPEQIALCKKFLQGACIAEDCLLSHKVSLEKMPTCKYYLEGCCVRPQCSYLHVKISPNAEICKNFLEGFCKEAKECTKRHQYLCPDYEKYGKCSKRRCRYPHKQKDKQEIKDLQIKINDKQSKTNDFNKKIDDVTKDTEEKEIARYYEEVKNNEVSSDNIELVIENNLEICKRPKLGDLPSFIPFD